MAASEPDVVDIHSQKVCTSVPSKDQLREYMHLFEEYCDNNRMIHIDSFKAIVSKLGSEMEKFAYQKLERETKQHNNLLSCSEFINLLTTEEVPDEELVDVFN